MAPSKYILSSDYRLVRAVKSNDVKVNSEKIRCGWASGDASLIEYHDREWGVPVHEDKTLFEFLVLEGAQAGLSWVTVLKRRESYREAFDGFDFEIIANYDGRKVNELLVTKGVIRNRLKIESVVANARAFLKIRGEFGTFDSYIWKFVGGRRVKNNWSTLLLIPAQTDVSVCMSKDLMRRGFRFVGPTICYSYMQAVGLVNDHITSCFRHDQL